MESHTNCACEFDISNNIPIPESRVKINPSKWRLGSTKYPYLKMNIGDSFLIPYNGKDPKHLAKCMYSSSNNFGRYSSPKLGFAIRKFAVRQEETGIRVWRLK